MSSERQIARNKARAVTQQEQEDVHLLQSFEGFSKFSEDDLKRIGPPVLVERLKASRECFPVAAERRSRDPQLVSDSSSPLTHLRCARAERGQLGTSLRKTPFDRRETSQCRLRAGGERRVLSAEGLCLALQQDSVVCRAGAGWGRADGRPHKHDEAQRS